MTQKQLDEKIKRHRHYINQDQYNSANMKLILCGEDLRGLDLSFQDLRCANFHGADLSYASLKGANLRCADLSSAKLCDTNLSDADLTCADLHNAYIRDALFHNAINVPHIPLACPSEGSFIGWKKVGFGYLVKLQIPASAKRSSATTNKCRCSKAKVLGIYYLNGNNADIESITTTTYTKCTYTVGKMVYPDSFDEDRWHECSHGIHFFIDKEDAIRY